jgi:hypothetical protein
MGKATQFQGAGFETVCAASAATLLQQKRSIYAAKTGRIQTPTTAVLLKPFNINCLVLPA